MPAAKRFRSVRNALVAPMRRYYGTEPRGLGQRLAAQLDCLVADGGWFRILHRNLAEFAPGAWRSNQPLPHQITGWGRRQGVKTIVNLRGAKPNGSTVLVRAAAARTGIRLIDHQLKSREPPSHAVLVETQHLFQSLAQPVLIHCKAGADRAGLAAVLYALFVQDQPLAQARRHLSLRHLHIKAGKAGVLDHVFDLAEAAGVRTGADLLAWTATDAYDPLAIKATFRPQRWADFLYDRMLGRE